MTTVATLTRLSELNAYTMPAGIAPIITSPIGKENTLTPIYVTAVADPLMTGHIGEILTSRPSPSGDGWIAQLPDRLIRVYGAEANPTPENGRYYHVRDRFIVRYNDDDHRGDRHRPLRPFSVVAGARGEAWPTDDDSLGELIDGVSVWVEVPFDGVSDVGQSAPEAEAEVQVETPVETIPDNSLEGPMRGLGQPEENGLVLKNPTRVIGETYLVWKQGMRNPFLATWVDDGETGEFLCHGSVAAYGTSIDIDSTQRNPLGTVTDPLDPVTWAKVRLRQPEPTTDEARIAVLRAELNATRSSFVDFNEALNEMADNRGHCGDYDAIIEKLGMDTRSKEWDVEVSVTVSFTDSSPSSAIDQAINRAYGISIETTEVRVEGTITTTVTVTAGSESSARDMVSSSEIEDRLGDDLPGDLEITDWEITDVSVSD